MSKRKSMAYQVKQQLGSVTCFGRSKHADKNKSNNYHPSGIYSVGTFKTYAQKCTAFCNWCREKHGCRTIEEWKTKYFRRCYGCIRQSWHLVMPTF